MIDANKISAIYMQSLNVATCFYLFLFSNNLDYSVSYPIVSCEGVKLQLTGNTILRQAIFTAFI